MTRPYLLKQLKPKTESRRPNNRMSKTLNFSSKMNLNQGMTTMKILDVLQV